MRSRRLSPVVISFCLNLYWLLPHVTGQKLQAPSKEGLRWEKRDAEVTLGAADKEAVAHYNFQNLSGEPITILALSTSCQCVHATADKKVYPPKDKGEITVTFTRTANQSAETKGAVMVQTDFSNDTGTVLNLKVKTSAAPIGSLEPASLTWKPNELQTGKSIKLVLPKAGPTVKDVSVTSTDIRVVAAQVRCVRADEEYEVIATPAAALQGTFQAKLIIRVDYGDGRSGKSLVVVTVN